MKRALIILVLPILYLFFVGKIVSFYVADLYATNSKVLLQNQDFVKAHASINRAIAANSHEPTYLRQKAKIFLAQKVMAEKDTAIELSASALEEVEKARELNPKNLTTLRNIIPLYYFMLIQEYSENDQHLKDYYAELKAVYANDLGMLADIAKNEKKAGFVEDYAYTRNMVEGLRPELLQWHEAFR